MSEVWNQAGGEPVVETNAGYNEKREGARMKVTAKSQKKREEKELREFYSRMAKSMNFGSQEFYEMKPERRLAVLEIYLERLLELKREMVNYPNRNLDRTSQEIRNTVDEIEKVKLGMLLSGLKVGGK
jgi:hypothetical protein